MYTPEICVFMELGDITLQYHVYTMCMHTLILKIYTRLPIPYTLFASFDSSK